MQKITTTTDQFLHKQQPTILEDRQRKNIQELTFLYMLTAIQWVLEEYTLVKLITLSFDQNH